MRSQLKTYWGTSLVSFASESNLSLKPHFSSAFNLFFEVDLCNSLTRVTFGLNVTPLLIKHCFLLLLLLNLVHPVLFAQQSTEEYILTKRLLSVEDGLASREVFCGLQDKYGFIWFGTRNGLNRYDGKKMLLFTRQHNGLQQNRVTHLAHDNANHLFIEYGESGYHRRTNGMVDVMDITTLKIQSLTETFPDMPFKERDVFWITNTDSNTLSILTANPFRLWEYSPSNAQKFKLIYNLKEGKDAINIYPSLGPYCFFPHSPHTMFYEIPNGCQFVSPNLTMDFKPKNGEYFIPFAQTKDGNYLFSYNTWQKPQSNFALINKEGKLEIPVDPKRYSLSEFAGKQFEATTIYNHTGTIITIAEDGVYLFLNNQLIPVALKKDNPVYKNLTVFKAFASKSGKLWLCTSLGVLQVKLKINRFHHYLTQKQQQVELNNQVRGIYVDTTGKLYANVWETLFVQDGKSLKHTTQNNQVNYRHLLYALHAHRGKIYSGGYVPLVYNEQQNQIQELKNNFTLQDVWSAYSLSDTVLLLGRNDDIEVYNIHSQKSKRALYAKSSFPKATFVYRFFNSKDGSLWAVSESGLFKLNQQGTVVEYYGENADSSHRLPYGNLSDACEDLNGNFWLATNGDGLYRWNRTSNTFKQFKITDGLPSDILYRIETDSLSNLWISSDYGLIQLNPNNYSMRTYTVRDGISNNEFNRISSFKGSDGKLYFGGLNGINAFYPSNFWNDTVPFTSSLQVVSISKFTTKDGLMVDISNEINRNKHIEIQPEDKFFRIEFMLLDFEQENHKYAYKIEGLDRDWNYIDENVIQLSGLPYGNYTLKIKGQNQAGQWSAQELEIPLRVITPFYQKTTFRLLAGLLLILFVVLLIRYRTYKLTKDNEALEHTVSQRTEELKELLDYKDVMMKEIHHRVKNNLQVISSLLEIQGIRSLDENIKAAITESQNRVLSIAFIHQNLYQQDNLKGVEMATFVNELTRHISTIFSNQSCPIEVENNIDHVYIDIDTAVPLGLIINELMTNSYKYAFNGRTSGKIKVALTAKQDGRYQLVYADNGIGLPDGVDFTQNKTLGLRLIKQLSKQLQGTMVYKFEFGSIFELELKDMSNRTKQN